MKVGELVKFKDVSSGADDGRGFFRDLNGMVGLILEVEMTEYRLDLGRVFQLTVFINGGVSHWHSSYFSKLE